jgi:cyclopropane-fatty-acyl-phospholipid synthase
LREWRRRFQDSRAEVARLYDERFCRMWEFYLAGCEVSFRHMDQMVFQIQLAKRQDSVPLTRGYMLDWERAHMSA